MTPLALPCFLNGNWMVFLPPSSPAELASRGSSISPQLGAAVDRRSRQNVSASVFAWHMPHAWSIRLCKRIFCTVTVHTNYMHSTHPPKRVYHFLFKMLKGKSCGWTYFENFWNTLCAYAILQFKNFKVSTIGTFKWSKVPLHWRVPIFSVIFNPALRGLECLEQLTDFKLYTYPHAELSWILKTEDSSKKPFLNLSADNPLQLFKVLWSREFCQNILKRGLTFSSNLHSFYNLQPTELISDFKARTFRRKS